MSIPLHVTRLQPWAILAVIAGLTVCLGLGFAIGMFYSTPREVTIVSVRLSMLAASELSTPSEWPGSCRPELSRWIKEQAAEHKQQRWIF